MVGALTGSPPPPDLSWRTNGITSLTVHVSSSTKPKSSVTQTPARWRTPEYFAYYLVIVCAVPFMFTSVINLSQPSSPNYPLYRHRLSQGWIFGRQVDTSDAQYRSFRSNFPALVLLALAHLLLSTLSKQRSPKGSSSAPQLSFSALLGLLVIVVLHGTSAFKILAILGVNYAIAKHPVLRGTTAGIAATWVFNVAMLFSNEIYDGYKYSSIYSGLSFLDSLSGVYPRWNVSFNITMLRLVSFNMDYTWAVRKTESHEAPATLDDRTRTTTAHSEATYTFTNYIAYALYPPLYIAGPIMTFNDFMWQIRRPLQNPLAFRVTYLVRFAITILTMEFLLHYIYVVAIKDAQAWAGDTPFELAMVGIWNLYVMWLKLLIPWRFFRLWALFDGVDPQENMVRCVANNYSTLGFWRSWHRSYNLWLIRYIYIPVGGSSYKLLSTLLVFTFVALWHDLTMRLLIWGWLISLFILPELIAMRLLPEKKYGGYWWYRHVCAAGGALNMVLMSTTNLVGFVLGTEGTKYMLGEMMGTWRGWAFIGIALPSLYCNVHVMFEYREEEKRRGIFRKC